jgi:hypothetical protein
VHPRPWQKRAFRRKFEKRTSTCKNREQGGIDPEMMAALLLHRSGDTHVFGAEEHAQAPTSNQEQAAKRTSRSSPRYRDVQRELTNRAEMDDVRRDMKHRGHSRLSQVGTKEGRAVSAL